MADCCLLVFYLGNSSFCGIGIKNQSPNERRLADYCVSVFDFVVYAEFVSELVPDILVDSGFTPR